MRTWTGHSSSGSRPVRWQLCTLYHKNALVRSSGNIHTSYKMYLLFCKIQNIQLTMNLIISYMWHHHDCQKRFKYKNGLQTRPRPLHLFLLVSAIGLLALAFVATTNRGWVYLDSVKTFQQAFLFLQQH